AIGSAGSRASIKPCTCALTETAKLSATRRSAARRGSGTRPASTSPSIEVIGLRFGPHPQQVGEALAQLVEHGALALALEQSAAHRVDLEQDFPSARVAHLALHPAEGREP